MAGEDAGKVARTGHEEEAELVSLVALLAGNDRGPLPAEAGREDLRDDHLDGGDVASWGTLLGCVGRHELGARARHRREGGRLEPVARTSDVGGGAGRRALAARDRGEHWIQI